MTYVLSDIHGHRQYFSEILTQIDLKADDTLYILGDVIDRGLYGIAILKWIMAQKNVKMLKGNHEVMMLAALRGKPYDPQVYYGGREWEVWMRNSGDVTLDAFSRCEVREQEQILQFLQSLPLEYDVEVGGKPYKLVHAAPKDLYVNYRDFYSDEDHFAVWARIDITVPHNLPYTYIFGHTPTAHYTNDFPMWILHKRDRIGIDCGAAMGDRGRVACLRLDDMQEFYSS